MLVVRLVHPHAARVLWCCIVSTATRQLYACGHAQWKAHFR